MSIDGWKKLAGSGVVAARMRSHRPRASRALGAPGTLQTVNGSASDRSAFGPSVVMSWRALLAAVLLSLALGVALYEAVAGGHSSAISSARLHPTSRIHAGGSSHEKGLLSLPTGAQGPVSEALGAESPSYLVKAFGGGFAAASPTQHFKLRFDRSGLSVSSGRAHVALSLRALGYGSSLTAVGAVAPRVKANRVVYARAGLTESYVNGPLGLEQSFTIAKAPSGHRTGALTLAMAISGNAHPSLRSGAQSVTFSDGGKSVLRYSGLSVTDAGGRVLHSWLALSSGQMLLRVDASGARYPLRIDPFIQQGEKLTGAGEASEAGGLSYSVAMSIEGTTATALIGARNDRGGVGAAWVFTRTGTTWTQQGAKLTAKSNEEYGDGEFGASVALSVESTTTTALIGAPGDSEHAGAAWVFTRTGTTWTQQGGKLTAKSGEEIGEGSFGYSVALLAKEGTTALIGAPGDKEGIGAAWVFTRSGTTWAQQGAKLVAKSGEETGAGAFGDSVAMSIESTTTTALIGAAGDKEGIGAAWVFTRSGTTWAQQGAKLVAKSGEETGAGAFGSGVALAVEGTTTTALIGASGDKEGIGAAWVFTRSGTTWTQQGAKLVAKSGEESASGEFGFSVALSLESTTMTALIGAPGDTEHAGAAWVFTRSGTTWTQQGAKFVAKSGEEIGEGSFGYSVALLAKEGTTALMGAPGDNRNVGASWAFARSGTTWTQQGGKLTAKSGEESGENEAPGKGAFGYSVAMSIEGTTTTALIGARNDRGGVGAAWVFTRSGTTWTQQGTKLIAKTPEEVGPGEFGASVALSVEGTTTTALIGAPGDNEGNGAAWVFTRTGTTWTQQGAKLVAKSGEEIGAGDFGLSVALLAKEGTTALIGAPGDKEQIGAAWVFTRSGTTWTQQGAKLVAKSGEETGKGEFGDSVAMSIESTTTTALIGARGDKEGIGAAWVFTRSGTTWAQQGAKLVAKSGEETGTGAFGSGVALAVEGTTTTALIGASGDKEGIGAAWVFTRSGTTWAQQGAKLVAKSGEETGTGFFGSSVALSIESTTMTALIGAPHDNTDIGGAWVFTRSGTTWTQQGTKLTAKTPEEFGKGEFGATVALLAKEGTTALFGAPGDNHNVGAAWAFARSGTTWTQQGEKLTAKSNEETPEGESAGKGAFGYSVALSSEGNTALIGGPPDLGVGAAWVFTRTGTTWTQQGAKLVAKSGEEIGSGEFGSSVALSANGSTALIGGYRDNADIGAAWVFTRSGTTWTQQGAKLTAKSGEETGEGEFGVSVALSAEGNTALIGASGEPLGFASHRGSAWVFTRSGTTWTQQGGKLSSSEGTGSSEFGFSVALAGSGNIALIGAPGDNTNVGASWVYTRSGTTWTQQSSKITPKSGEETGEGLFGYSVALSSEGNTALIGGPFNKEGTGAAWVFTSSGSTWAQQGEKLTGSGETGEGEFGSSLALGANGRAALIGAPQDNGNLGAAWVFTRSGAAWTQQGAKLTPKSGEEIGEGQFGFSVALSSEANTALIGGTDDNNTIGAAWTFASTSPFVETKPATSITQTTATLNGTVNPNGVEVTKCEFEYGTSISYGKTAACTPAAGSGSSQVAVSAAITTLSANTTYHFRIIATNSGGSTQGQDELFKTAPSPPAVVTKPASAITQTTATLNGTVNPNGVEVTKCEFEYGTSLSYGKTAKCTALPGSGESPVAVSAPITGLTANIGYHFRLVAATASAEGKGADESFTTSPGAPVVETKPASSITYNTAVLNATVNPEGSNVTTCILEIATAEFYEAKGKSYESGEECASLPGSGTSPVPVSALAGVSAKTVYHFRILACNASGCAEGADLTFETLPNPPTVETKPASSITMTSATLNATVNPNSGTVGKCEFEYGTTVAYGKTATCVPSPGSAGAPVAVTASAAGLTAGTSYHFRIVAENAGGTSKGADETFGTVPNPPTVETKPASSITQTSATFTGTVNPNSGTTTKCEFEYGTTVSYGKTAPCVPSTISGSSPVAVSATVTGLTANTTYHYKLVASNAGGKGEGADETVKTLVNPPTVETKPASSITQTSVTLNGSVNPNSGEVSKCEFEYGTTVSYGKTIACVPSPGSGSSAVPVSASVTGLVAGTTYHFRVVAVNAGGKGEGADAMFETSPSLSAPTVVTGAGAALTASVASVNATVNPNNGQVSECVFEYGPTVSYGSSVPCRPTPGPGTSAVAVSAPIGGLKAGTTYHFRVAAANSAGGSTGSDQMFTTPAAANAHWYSNASRVQEGNRVPYVSWGTLVVTPSKGGGSTECLSSATGYVENSRGAVEGAFEQEGVDVVTGLGLYDCTNAECEAGGGTAGVSAESFPWLEGLSEEVKGTFRLASTGVQLFVHCYFSSAAATEKPGTGVNVGREERTSTEYNAVGATTCTTNAGGSMKPKVVNGASAEQPTKMQFTAGAGGTLECGTGGKLSTTGSLKIFGFEEKELITVKNP